MTESPNNQRRRPGQSRGLRSRQRSRNGENQNSQRPNGQGPRTQQANRHRKPDAAKNNTKPGQRRKPTRSRTPHNKLDSEADFRLARPSALQQQTHNHQDESVLFSQTQFNGNRRGKSLRNGQHWTPSDGGIYLDELRGSDWYREDQARYAAKQIALENAEQRRAQAERHQNGEAGQTRRPPPRPRNVRNPRQRQNHHQNSRPPTPNGLNGEEAASVTDDQSLLTSTAAETPAPSQLPVTPQAETAEPSIETPPKASEEQHAAELAPSDDLGSPEKATGSTAKKKVSRSTTKTVQERDKKQKAEPAPSAENDQTNDQVTASADDKPKRTRTSATKSKAASAKADSVSATRKAAAATTEKPKATRKAAATRTAKKTTTRTRKVSKEKKDSKDENDTDSNL